MVNTSPTHYFHTHAQWSLKRKKKVCEQATNELQMYGKWLYWLEDNSNTIWINWSTGKECGRRQSQYLTNEHRNVEARKGEMCVENNGLLNGISCSILLFYDLLITIRWYLAFNRQSSLAEVPPQGPTFTLSNTTSDERGIPFNIPSIEKLVPLSHTY